MSTKLPPPDSSPSAESPSLISTPPPQTNANPPRTPPSVLAPPPDFPVVPPPDIVSSPPPDLSPPPPPIAPTISPTPPTSSISPPPPLVKPPENSPPPPEALSTPPPEESTPPVDSPPPPPPLSLQSPTISPPPPLEISPPPPPESKPPQISPPPPVQSKPPHNSPPAPPQSKPPQISPPPPPLESNPPENSPPPPSSKPPENSSPPPLLTSKPPQTSPSPPSPKPPQNSPSPPSPKPPQNSSPPPPLKSKPPQNSPPQPPSSKPPNSSPPPPASKPPGKSPLPLRRTPPPISQPTLVPSNSPPQALPVIRLTPPSPPPSSASQPSSSPSQTLVPPIGTINPSSHGNAGVSTVVIVAISALLGLLVLSMIGLLVWFKMKRKRKVYGLSGGYAMPSPFSSSQDSEAVYTKPNSSAPLIGKYSGSNLASSPRNPSGLGHSRPLFSYEEMFVATNGFSAHNLLGEGGFGPVYKGSLPDGQEIAVKQLKIGGSQGVREFEAEVETISRIHHRHLVSLVGYCIAEDRRLLIYEYVPNDTLYSHLHGVGRPVMDWATRVKVAAGAARGIAYLHEDCHPRIIHRDIKSSNILLDENFEARVSDFGLAKLAIDAATHITTRVMGTFGYMAPEYASSGKLTEKSDVYSFGVVLLELITGRKPVDTSQSLGDESVVEWARPLLSDAFDTNQCDALVDPKLEKNYVESEMFRMIEAAAACVRHSAVKRPQMGQVVRALDSVATSDLTNGMRPGQSQVYNSAEKSSEIKLFRRMAFGCENYSTEYFTQSSSMTGVKSDML